MTDISLIRVGGEIDALCNKCELNLAHTIIAMVGHKIKKVECNTCNNVHAYKGSQPLVAAQGFARPRVSKAKATKAEKVIISWEAQLKGKDVASARKYDPNVRYVADDVIDHPTFGLGFVNTVRVEKIDVAFKASEKTLIHGRGSPLPTISMSPKKHFGPRRGPSGPRPPTPVPETPRPEPESDDESAPVASDDAEESNEPTASASDAASGHGTAEEPSAD